MPETRPAYPAEFRRQMVDPVHAGRDPTDLARELEPSGQTIRNWVAEVDRSEGRREGTLPSAHRGLPRWEPAMANHLRAELVLDALEMAVAQRRPRDVIHHSDQGSQYTSLAFGSRRQEARDPRWGRSAMPTRSP